MHNFIGIIGGVGPHAGLQLAKEIFKNTNAACDQDHVPLCLLNLPMIPDRSRYLMNPDTEPHPQDAVLAGIDQLELLKVSIFAIPCNTAHAPAILNPILEEMKLRNYKIRFLHLVQETLMHIKRSYPSIQKIGLLSTAGTYLSEVYEKTTTAVNRSEGGNLSILVPPTKEEQLDVHDSIYNPTFGIKAQSDPIDQRAIAILVKNAYNLIEKGAEVIVLGCTEISLLARELSLSVPCVDPLNIVARRLIQETFPLRLST